MFRSNVLVCGGTGCTSSNSEKIIEKLKEEISAKGLDQEVNVVRTGCFGLCALGPIMIVYPEGAFYSRVTPEDVPEIVEEHLLKGRIVRRLLYKETVVDESTTKSLNETTFYAKQMRVALRNCGVINPEQIDEYIALDGYQAIGKILTEKIPPQQVIQTMLDSGLRGRGGAGFPTGLKWKFAAANDADQKYVCCNADEGDPGAFMDRSILEGDPHSVIEAMTIAGYAIGATQGYIYIRAEYPIAVHRLQIAINQAREYGLLGKNIFDSGFDFDLEIRLGAGAFVCGEETALMTSIEGKRGEPRCRPPFPALKGLFQKPTVLNNVETYANIPQIFLKGPQWFRSIGTEKSAGTKVFALGGKINNTGLVEVPMGTTLREVVEEIGGGIPGGHKFKAAQTGGPSGGCIPASLIDTPIDYDSLIAIGSSSLWMKRPAWSISQSSSLSSRSMNPAASAPRVVSVRSACLRFSTRLQAARAHSKTSISLKSSATTLRKTPSAVSARQRRTRFFPHSSITVMSTLRTSPSIAARQVPARPSRITSSMRTSARAARSAHVTARSAPSPALSVSRMSSIRRSASSAASAVKSASSAPSKRSKEGS